MKKGIICGIAALFAVCCGFVLWQCSFMGISPSGRIPSLKTLAMPATLAVGIAAVLLCALICMGIPAKKRGSAEPVSKTAGIALAVGGIIFICGAVSLAVRYTLERETMLGIVYIFGLLAGYGMLSVARRISKEDAQPENPVCLLPAVWMMAACMIAFLFDPTLSSNQMRAMLQCALAFGMLHWGYFAKMVLRVPYSMRLMAFTGFCSGIFSGMTLCYGAFALYRGGAARELIPILVFALGLGITSFSGALLQLGKPVIKREKVFRTAEPDPDYEPLPASAPESAESLEPLEIPAEFSPEGDAGPLSQPPVTEAP